MAKKSIRCAAFNCPHEPRNIPKDPRTGKPYRFHKFPNKDRDLTRIWLSNVGRDDLSEDEVANKYLCSLHFGKTQYNNQNDISKCQLKYKAVPNVIEKPVQFVLNKVQKSHQITGNPML